MKANRTEYNKYWYLKNHEYNLQNKREYYIKNRESIKEYQKQYRLDNPEKRRITVNATARKRYANNPIPELARVNARRAKTSNRINYYELNNWQSKICGICNKFIAKEFEIDHLIPLSKGGKHEISNLQLSHPTCNARKGNRLISLFNMQ